MDDYFFWVASGLFVAEACVLLLHPADAVLTRVSREMEEKYRTDGGETNQGNRDQFESDGADGGNRGQDDKCKISFREKSDDQPAIEGKFIGRAERLFFMVVVALKLPGFLVAMFIWIGAKMAANWRRKEDGNASREVRAGSIRALTLGIISLGMALVIGLTLRWTIVHLFVVLA